VSADSSDNQQAIIPTLQLIWMMMKKMSMLLSNMKQKKFWKMYLKLS
jgi:hypothetical protein